MVHEAHVADMITRKRDEMRGEGLGPEDHQHWKDGEGNGGSTEDTAQGVRASSTSKN